MGIAEDIERELSTDHRARERARREVILGFVELPWQDQFKVYKFAQGHFMASRRGAEVFDEARRRAECVRAIEQAVAHLGLPEGSSLGWREYDRARRELGLPFSSAAIIRRWGSWDEVSKAARGERVSETPRQRAHRRAAIRRRPKGEEWLAGVREWLAEGGASTCEADYNAWARERNQARPGLPPVSLAISAREALVLPWSTVVEVARREASLAEAQAEHLEAQVRAGGGFASITVVALLHGVSAFQAARISGEESFPAFAFKLGRRRAWHLSDLKAHRARRPFPVREPGELQGEVWDSTQVRRLCGLSAKQMNHALSLRGERIPPPAGVVANKCYWWRREVEQWARGRSLSLGPPDGSLDGPSS